MVTKFFYTLIRESIDYSILSTGFYRLQSPENISH